MNRQDRNMTEYIRTTEKQYKRAVSYSKLLKYNLTKAKKQLSQRLALTVSHAESGKNAIGFSYLRGQL